ncbi:hypothetical protein [Planomonospora venezuelensis]|uniref:NADPH-dependent ferric siderophore reductase n=1 Tax=Planomonospora venezuelensis TaxID=1999 RepID=A0A841DBX0_PLAVE|nr:hypothetical protein [Planomonospora venezuelensis]MBB5967520.1 NADPH-dependent ferric siderophore reductase [Planomonospora venezuelensis]GIN04810.1 hypothetical protein Pve01_64680 [Planomonospora venezuelensis]
MIGAAAKAGLANKIGEGAMAETGMTALRVKPAVSEPLTLRVLRSERISPDFMRVTLGEDRVLRLPAGG